MSTAINLLRRKKIKVEVKRCADDCFDFHHQYLVSSIESFIASNMTTTIGKVGTKD